MHDGTDPDAIVLWIILAVAIGHFVIRKSTESTLRKAARDWPSTRGEIIESCVARTRLPVDEGEPDCQPSITYRYTVNGREYTSDKVSIKGFEWVSKDAASATLGFYRVGKEVTVYYNPEYPSQALLNRD